MVSPSRMPSMSLSRMFFVYKCLNKSCRFSPTYGESNHQNTLQAVGYTDESSFARQIRLRVFLDGGYDGCNIFLLGIREAKVLNN